LGDVGVIFFTRHLYNGSQPNSGWERRAERQLKRNAEIYHRYATVIAPLLPPAVVRLDQSGPHDAVVTSVTQPPGSLSLSLDAQYALGQYRGYHVCLTFTGVKKRINTQGLVGQWWLYQEAHLTSRSCFALHVFFDDRDIEIEADELKIKKTKIRKSRKSTNART
jgi:hypothetical protein